MGFLNKIFKREAEQKAVEPMRGVNVVSNRVHANSATAIQVGACYHAMELRANAVALAHLHIERKVGGVWRKDVTDVAGAGDMRHLDYLLKVRPNDRMTADQMWRRVMNIRDTYGLAGLYVLKTGKYVHALVPCRASWNAVDNTYQLDSTEYMKTWMGVPADDVIVIRGMHDGVKNVSLMDVARRTLELYLTADNMATETLAKGGTMKMFVSEDTASDPLQGLASMDDEEVHSSVDDLREQVAQNYDVVFSNGDLKTEVRSQSFQDLQIGDHKTKAIEDVSRIFGVPLPLMFCSTNAVYKSIDDAFHTFIAMTIAPIQQEIEQEMNAKLLGEDRYGVMRFHWDNSMLCLDSENVKAQAAQIRRNSGITTANEERVLLGLAPVEGGDELDSRRDAETAEN